MASNTSTSNNNSSALDAFAAQAPSIETSGSDLLSFFRRFNNPDAFQDHPPHTSLPVSSRRSSVRFSHWLFLGFLAIALSVWIVQTTLLGPRDVAFKSLRDCDITLSFPLPRPISKTAHRAVLIQLGHMERYPGLIAGYSDLDLSLRITGEKLDKLSSCTCSFTYEDEFVAFSQRLAETAAKIDRVTSLHSQLQLAYSTLNATAVAISEAHVLSRSQQFAVQAGPWSLAFLGLNATKLFWDPWVDKQKKAQEAQAGLAALNLEITRLEWIDQVLQELNQKIQQLVHVAPFWCVNHYDGSVEGPETAWLNWLRRWWEIKVSDRRQGSMYGWIQKHITHNSRLRGLWNELPTLISAGDEVIVIRISRDWF